VATSRYFEQTFWPGTMDKAKAEPIEVRAGSEVRDVNITAGPALPAFTVSGRVIDAESGKSVAGCNIGLGHRTPGGGYDYSGGNYFGLAPVATDDDGYFKIVGVIPGRFFLGADFPEGLPLFARMVDFEVHDKDVAGLEIKAIRGVTISGAVMIEDNCQAAQGKLAQLKIVATSRFEGGAAATEPNTLIYPSSQRQGSVAKDGAFRITGLQSGEFEISISGEAEQCFSLVRIEYPKVAAETKAQMITARPQPSSIPLVLEGGDLNGVRVILAYRSSRIRGHVDIKGGISPAGQGLHAFADRADGGSGSGVREIYADGDFLIGWLEPGEYRISIATIGVQTVTLSDIKTVHLGRDTESRISFVIDLSGKK
jgi:hypothetical protein